MTMLLRKVKGLQQRSERLSKSLHTWRSTGYESQVGVGDTDRQKYPMTKSFSNH